MSKRGAFITFEGVDGCGKSTQLKILGDFLRERGRDVVLTREPGGSAGAEEIRRLVLEGDPDRWSAKTEILLFTAARRDHCERVICPALEAGKIVISDRFADSTRTFQGVTRGDLREIVDDVHELMIGFEPDLTILIDMDPQVALARSKGRMSGEERFEDFGLELQEKVQAYFLTLAHEHSHRFVIIPGEGSIDDVFTRVKDAVIKVLEV